MIKIVFLIIGLCALVDVLIKEFYVKRYLLIQKWEGHWWKVNNFWKDSIDYDHWYRVRWAIVINLIFTIIAGIWTFSIYGSLLYIYLALINIEHIMYQWIAGLLVRDKKWFDLTDTPGWMEGLILNKWFARYHNKEKVTSEEILTIAILGTIILFIINLF